MGRTIIIGDVHGMRGALDQLLGRLKPSQQDHLVYVGDLVDKGPDSVGVVDLVRQMSEMIPTTVVKGNHELALLKFAAAWAMGNGRGMHDPVGKLRLLESLGRDNIEFLRRTVPFLRLEDHDILVVHGGVLPEWADGLDPKNIERIARVRHVTGTTRAKVTVEFSGLDFDPSCVVGDTLDADRVRALCSADLIEVVRKRVKPEGSFISLGDESADDPFWASVYDGRFGLVVFGHEPFSSVKHFAHAVGIDTGAVYGGGLAAMVVEPDGSYSFTVVPTEKFAERRHERV